MHTVTVCLAGLNTNLPYLRKTWFNTYHYVLCFEPIYQTKFGITLSFPNLKLIQFRLSCQFGILSRIKGVSFKNINNIFHSMSANCGIHSHLCHLTFCIGEYFYKASLFNFVTETCYTFFTTGTKYKPPVQLYVIFEILSQIILIKIFNTADERGDKDIK